jgi:1-acyl-sn-glycerol-3-phosphate acyltransferase
MVSGVLSGAGVFARGRIGQGVRVLSSGILFSFLGVGGWLASVVAVPLLRLAPGGALARQRRARWMIHVFFKGFTWALQASGILRLRVEGLPEPQALEGKLILANHPGYLDVVVIISVLGRSACIVKEGVFHNFFFGGLVRAAGHVYDPDPERALALSVGVLAKGESLIVFPEGTRTSPDRPLHFQRGAAHIALNSRAGIVPLIVTTDPPLLEKGARWYDMPIRTCQYRVCVQAPLTLELPGIGDMPPPQAARLLTRELESHFNKEVHASGYHPT